MDSAEFFRLLAEVVKTDRSLVIMGNALCDFPDIGAAYQYYADALGKPVDKLTDNERRQAVMNAVLSNAE